MVQIPREQMIAARDAYSGAADQWASAEYRSDTAAALGPALSQSDNRK